MHLYQVYNILLVNNFGSTLWMQTEKLHCQNSWDLWEYKPITEMVGGKRKTKKPKNKKQFLLYKSSVCFFLRWFVGIQSCVNISLSFSHLLKALLGLRWTHCTCCHLQNPKLCSDVEEFCLQNPKCCSIVGEFCLRYSTSTCGIDETKEKFVAM
jgi:hypothetical protein